MFLSDLNILFLLPGVNHRHTSLPRHPPAAATWALLLHPAASRGGTNQEQMGSQETGDNPRQDLGDYFILHVTTQYPTLAALWDPDAQY